MGEKIDEIADIFDKMNITVSHDDLLAQLGPDAVEKIKLAGFVLVPKVWRTNAFKALTSPTLEKPKLCGSD